MSIIIHKFRIAARVCLASPAILLAIILSLTGCNPPERPPPEAAEATSDGPPPAVVTGTVKGTDGSVPGKARVSVQVGGRSGEVMRSVPVEANGNFQVALDTAGVSRLTVTGVHRDEASPASYLVRGDTARMNVRLAPPTLDEDSAEVAVRGTFNDFEVRSGMVPMTSRNGGPYAATVPAAGDSLAYQVVAETEGRRVSVAGTDADRYEYRDRRSGHQSVVAAPGDSVTVTFDPAQLPDGGGSAEIAFADSTSPAARYNRFTEALQARYNAYLQSRRDDRVKADTIDWSMHHRKIRGVLERDVDSRRRNAYLTTYLRYTPDIEPELARRAINEIPADDPAWTLRGFRPLPYRAAAAAGDLETYRSFFYDVLQSHPSTELKAGLLLQMLVNAKQEGSEDRQRLLYAWMAGEYSDTRYAEIARARFNPDKRVQAGKPVPGFEVGALRGDRAFTPADFEGQHVLIDFWATWCQPCIEEFPNLRAAYQRYDRDELAILSVSLDEERNTVTSFLQNHDLPWQHAFAKEAFGSPIAEQFQVTAIPKPVLVGPDGTIVAAGRRLQGETLMETLGREVGPAAEDSFGSVSPTEEDTVGKRQQT